MAALKRIRDSASTKVFMRPIPRGHTSPGLVTRKFENNRVERHVRRCVAQYAHGLVPHRRGKITVRRGLRIADKDLLNITRQVAGHATEKRSQRATASGAPLRQSDQARSLDNLRFLERLLGKPVPGPTPGYDNDVTTDFWDNVESPEFQRRCKETETGPLVIGS